ncbi:MAG: NAD(P)/FAD-dependent oxidoreductase [bacterium]|nr:NAD(P)/FAD-dependent oxidoreductase [bacterium]MDZ4296588.1 NAD(P)/FAD-dependent oxidoreductase [Patescibacteria group bacterium]
MDSPTKNNIVILGGGFGGLRAALDLERIFTRNPALGRENEIVLVDAKNYHCYTPALYEVASTIKQDIAALALKTAVTIPFERILAGKSVTFVQGAVKRIDASRCAVVLGDGTTLDWQILVLALGAETNFFHLPGVEDESIPFKSFDDALAMRRRVSEFLEKSGPANKTLNVVIGGGGLNAVELAGEITNYLKKVLRRRRRKSLDYALTLVEATPEILPGLNARVVAWARKRLDALGVNIITGRRITRATPLKVLLDSGELPCSLFFWAGGIKANRLLEALPFAKDRGGRVVVDERLAVVGSDQPVFALGDNACFMVRETSHALAWTALVAQHQGRFIAHNIGALLLQKPLQSYNPPSLRFVIPIGGRWAIADLGRVKARGFFMWVLKELVFLRYLLRVLPPVGAVGMWLRAVWVFMKND